jgi:hypothetical protein
MLAETPEGTMLLGIRGMSDKFCLWVGNDAHYSGARNEYYSCCTAFGVMALACGTAIDRPSAIGNNSLPKCVGASTLHINYVCNHAGARGRSRGKTILGHSVSIAEGDLLAARC